MRYKKLGYRLSLIILPIVFVIFIITIFYNSYLSRQLVKEAMDDRVMYQAEAINNRIYSLLFPLERLARKESINVKGFLSDYSIMLDYLDNIIESNPEAHGASFTLINTKMMGGKAFEIGVYRTQGKIEHYQKDVKPSIAFIQPKNYKDPQGGIYSYWSEPYFENEESGAVLTSYSVPIYLDKKFIGVARIDLSLVQLTEYISNLKILQKGYAFLLSKEGRYIAYPDTNFILKQTIFSQANATNRSCLNDAGLRMVNGDRGSELLFGVKGGNGPEYLYFEPLQENVGWSLGLVYPERELLAKIRELNLRLLIVGVLGIIILSLSIVWIGRRITKRLGFLVEAANNIGDGDFNTLIPQDKVKDEIGLLTATFNRTQIKLGDYYEKLKKTTEAKEKIESELRIAYEIQQGIIPQIFPPFPDRSEIDLYATLEPAKVVGGDLYDFFFVDEKNLVFAIGDVSGKGVPASLFMAITRTLLRANAVKGVDALKLVQLMNKGLCHDNQNEMFVTFFLGIFDLETGIIECCNAGHNHPYIIRKDGSIDGYAKTDGIPIGIMTDFEYSSGQIKLNQGDSLILYTDGIPDAVNEKQDFYGEEKLKNLIASLSTSLSPKEMIEALMVSNKEFVASEAQNDDITLLTLKYLKEPKNDSL